MKALLVQTYGYEIYHALHESLQEARLLKEYQNEQGYYKENCMEDACECGDYAAIFYANGNYVRAWKCIPIKENTYDQGMNDAWEMMRRFVCFPEHGGMYGAELEEIFGVVDAEKILNNFTPQEVKAKIEAWEKANAEIKVGDVVNMKYQYSEGIFVVTCIKDDMYTLMNPEGRFIRMCSKEGIMTKTGRSVDIASVLEQIGG